MQKVCKDELEVCNAFKASLTTFNLFLNGNIWETYRTIKIFNKLSVVKMIPNGL